MRVRRPGAIRVTGTCETAVDGTVKIRAFLMKNEKLVLTLPKVTAEKGKPVEKLLEVTRRELTKVKVN